MNSLERWLKNKLVEKFPQVVWKSAEEAIPVLSGQQGQVVVLDKYGLPQVHRAEIHSIFSPTGIHWLQNYLNKGGVYHLWFSSLTQNLRQIIVPFGERNCIIIRPHASYCASIITSMYYDNARFSILPQSSISRMHPQWDMSMLTFQSDDPDLVLEFSTRHHCYRLSFQLKGFPPITYNLSLHEFSRLLQLLQPSQKSGKGIFHFCYNTSQLFDRVLLV